MRRRACVRRRAGVWGGLEGVGRWRHRSTPSDASRLAPSTLPVGDATDFDMGYSQSEFFVDLCVNVLVRPTRISPRQSGAAGPCSTLRGCTARPDRRLRTAVSSADRAESLGLYKVYRGVSSSPHTVHLCLGLYWLGVRGPGIAVLRSIRAV